MVSDSSVSINISHLVAAQFTAEPRRVLFFTAEVCLLYITDVNINVDLHLLDI